MHFKNEMYDYILIISTKKHLTVDYRWDFNEGINRWVFIFCTKMKIPAVSRGSGEQMWVCA